MHYQNRPVIYYHKCSIDDQNIQKCCKSNESKTCMKTSIKNIDDTYSDCSQMTSCPTHCSQVRLQILFR